MWQTGVANKKKVQLLDIDYDIIIYLVILEMSRHVYPNLQLRVRSGAASLEACTAAAPARARRGAQAADDGGGRRAPGGDARALTAPASRTQ